MEKTGDFHLHTWYSDGADPPAEVVRRAHRKGLSWIAVTDHDTTLGVGEAIAAGAQLGVTVIPGIELTTEWNQETIHVLGYYADGAYLSEKLQRELEVIRAFRRERARQILANLKRYYAIDVPLAAVEKNARGLILRLHIARAITECGYRISWRDLYAGALNRSSPAFVENRHRTTPEGIALLRSTGAQVVLAHPTLIKKTPAAAFSAMNFDGFEAVYPQNKPGQEAEFRALARQSSAFVTAGSDYHGQGDSDEEHGDIGDAVLTQGEVKIFLERLGTKHGI